MKYQLYIVYKTAFANLLNAWIPYITFETRVGQARCMSPAILHFRRKMVSFLNIFWQKSTIATEIDHSPKQCQTSWQPLPRKMPTIVSVISVCFYQKHHVLVVGVDALHAINIFSQRVSFLTMMKHVGVVLVGGVFNKSNRNAQMHAFRYSHNISFAGFVWHCC